MKVHTLDIDSGERDPILYPNPSDYVVYLKTPIYDVTKISLISARIHNSQLLIHDRNNTFSISGQTISLPNDNYSGTTLANEIVTQSSNISSAIYDRDTNTIEFTAPTYPFTFDFYGGTNGYVHGPNGYTTPHDILGLPASNVSSDGLTLKTGSVNLQGADAIIVKMSSGSDEFNKTVFS